MSLIKINIVIIEESELKNGNQEKIIKISDFKKSENSKRKEKKRLINMH